MREAAFVKQNMKRWKEYEHLLQNRIQKPDEKARIYIQLTDDLAFAQTQYPDSETTRYLNHLGSRIHQQIYSNKKEERKRFLSFWTTELPLLFATLRRPMLYSFVITLISTAIGVISALGDRTFVRLILGDSYVNMTLENIRSGNPTGVYSSSDALPMFLYIPLHNIWVSFLVFAAGIIFSVGTGYLLFSNGVMLGAFLTLFYMHDVFLESAGVVMLHGTLEISAIIIAGAAGLRMGNSFLFPGTYSRIESFRRGAGDGLKLVMGLVPVFLIAGFIESYITRYSLMPALLKGFIIGISLLFIIFYFFVYPFWLQNHVPENRTPENP